jgi:hypothetical protein
MNATLSISSRRELAHRSSNGIDVRLFWSPADNSVTVAVDDALGAAFELDVAPERALDAFNHPYAYAPSTRDVELLDVAA